MLDLQAVSIFFSYIVNSSQHILWMNSLSFSHCLSPAMVPEYWLTEGGQSATGALLDCLMENHAASRGLSNRAASQSRK